MHPVVEMSESPERPSVGGKPCSARASVIGKIFLSVLSCYARWQADFQRCDRLGKAAPALDSILPGWYNESLRLLLAVRINCENLIDIPSI